jgi:hypothetical protein
MPYYILRYVSYNTTMGSIQRSAFACSRDRLFFHSKIPAHAKNFPKK